MAAATWWINLIESCIIIWFYQIMLIKAELLSSADSFPKFLLISGQFEYYAIV